MAQILLAYMTNSAICVCAPKELSKFITYQFNECCNFKANFIQKNSFNLVESVEVIHLPGNAKCVSSAV